MKKSRVAVKPSGPMNPAAEGSATRLSDPAFAEQAQALKTRLSNDPAFARNMLHQAGIINSRGRLTKSFGG